MTIQTLPGGEARRRGRLIDPEIAALLALLAFVCLAFGLMSPGFLSGTTFTSIAFQLPELGLLTLAMLMPIISSGFNLAVTFTANLSGLAMAAVLHAFGGVDAGPMVIALGIVAALATGSAVGWLMGAIIATTGAHPILVSLSMMIFVRGSASFSPGAATFPARPTRSRRSAREACSASRRRCSSSSARCSCGMC